MSIGMGLGSMLAFASAGFSEQDTELLLHPEKFGDYLAKKLGDAGKVHYDILQLHQIIGLKGLIAGNKAERSAISHRVDQTEFELLYMMKHLMDWRTVINIMLDKWQKIEDEHNKRKQDEESDHE